MMTGKIWPQMEQRSEAWFRARGGRPTASHFARILTAGGKDSSQWQGFADELIGQSIDPSEIPAFFGSAHTERGNEHEPEARDLFARLTGYEVETVGFITRRDGVVGCSPDSLLRIHGDYAAGLEIKCPMAKTHVGYYREWQDDTSFVPSQYMAQIHGSMAVTGLRLWWFMSYYRGMAPVLTRVPWSSYTDDLAAALDRFVIYYAGQRKKLIPKLKDHPSRSLDPHREFLTNLHNLPINVQQYEELPI
jgi:hypothetical protein